MVKVTGPGNSCPKTVVPYNGHQFVGKAQKEILGRDYRTFVFDVNSESLYVTFGDNVTAGVGYNMGASTLDGLGSKILDSYNDFVANSGNTTQISYTVSGGFLYITVIGTLNNNLQMTIRNDNSGVRADGSNDPESDGIEGREPTFFFISGNSKCEIIELNSDTFNCETDKVLFFREGQGQTVNGEVFGWSNPEGVQWSNVPTRDNRQWTILINIDTNGIGFQTITLPGAVYTSFNALIDAINGLLQTYGSTFRVVGSTSLDRIFVTQDNGTIIVGDSDPYLTANSYNNLELDIMDTVTSSDWLIKGRNPKGFFVSNVVTGGAGGMFHGQMPCPTSSLVGNDKHITRANATLGVAPTAIEVSTPMNGDTAKINLTDGTIEFWSYNGTIWIKNFASLTRSISIVNITATTTLNATHHKVLVSNGATNITITFPDALTCLGREYIISRAAGSTGSITIVPSSGSIQTLAGTVGATTSIGLHSTAGRGLNHTFTAINIAGVGFWVRI